MNCTNLNTAAEILEAFRACNNPGEEIELFECLATRPNPPVGAFVDILRSIKLEAVLALTIQAFGKITDADIKARLKESEDLLTILSQQAQSGSSDLIKWSAATAIGEIGFNFLMVAQYLSEDPTQIADRIVKLKLNSSKDSDEFIRFSNYGPLDSRWKYVHSFSINSPTTYGVISPDGQTFFSKSYGDGTIKIWQVSTGKELCTLTGHPSGVYDLTISPDGQTLFSCGGDRNIKIWQVSTGREICTITGHNDSFYRLAISPDGQTLFSGAGDGTIKVWQISSGKKIRSLIGHTDLIYALAISPDGETLFSSSKDKTIRMWQVSTGKELRTFTGYSRGGILAISPDGQTLFSVASDIGVGKEDKTIKIWHVSTGKELRRILTSPYGQVSSLAISPDGQTLFGIDDKTIKIWQVSTGKELWNITSYFSFRWLSISPDGQCIFTNSYDHISHQTLISIWRRN